MLNLSNTEIVDAWQQAVTQSTYQRPLTLIAAACPDTPPDKLAMMSVGQRDANLLELRKRIFGPDLCSVAMCSGCGEKLELNFSVSDIQIEGGDYRDDKVLLKVDGYELEFRLPNSLDLLSISAQPDIDSARQLLIEHCVVHASLDDQELAAEQLPPEIVDAVTSRMAEVDPQADVRLALICPACGREWQETFDIAAYFWIELEAWVRRILYEVHTLATSYGWSESDILEMNPWRRQLYLNLARDKACG
jgi:hypothetical protein